MSIPVDAREQATAEVILEILRLGGRLASAGDALVGDLGLTSARWQVLATVGFSQGGETVSGIARSLGLARQSVQRVVTETEVDGLVQLVDNPAHRRARLVTLTDPGKRALDGADARRKVWTNRLAHDLEGLDVEAARDVLVGLREALDQPARDD